ncbi:MAG: winged helix-turn-helix domain-containing protein, partial [Roseococcus sp.]
MDTPPGPDLTARLRAAIRDGSLPPGQRLTEQELARRFGVSRTPIRQALARLEAEATSPSHGRCTAHSRNRATRCRSCCAWSRSA